MEQGGAPLESCVDLFFATCKLSPTRRNDCVSFSFSLGATRLLQQLDGIEHLLLLSPRLFFIFFIPFFPFNPSLRLGNAGIDTCYAVPRRLPIHVRKSTTTHTSEVHRHTPPASSKHFLDQDSNGLTRVSLVPPGGPHGQPTCRRPIDSAHALVISSAATILLPAALGQQG